MADHNDSPDPERGALTDSPWFWLYVFSMAALAGLLLIGPKYLTREAGIESKYQAREQVSRARAAGTAPSAAAQADEPPAQQQRPLIVPIWTLSILVAMLLVTAVAGLVWTRGRSARSSSR